LRSTADPSVEKDASEVSEVPGASDLSTVPVVAVPVAVASCRSVVVSWGRVAVMGMLLSFGDA
jgi:hypothetical protein